MEVIQPPVLGTTDIHATSMDWNDERIEHTYANSISQIRDISDKNTIGIRGKRIQALEIEIKQHDKYCTVKEVIQFRPATYDELRQQLDLRSDSLGAEMKSNNAGYVHSKENKSQDNINHFIHEYDTTHSAISFRAKIYRPPSVGQRPQYQREIVTKIKEKKEAEKEFNKAVRENKQAFLAKNQGSNYLQIKLGNIAFNESIVVEYIYLVSLKVSRNLRFNYGHDTAKLDNLHYHEFNEETPWKLYIPLVRSGGYLLEPNPGESPKEDMNSQLDLLHMNDEQVWSLTKGEMVSPISIYLNAEVKNGQRCLRKIVNCYNKRGNQRTEFVVPVNEAIDNRISLTPGSYPLYPEPHQKSLQTIDLNFYFHKAQMNHIDLIQDKENPNRNIFLGMDTNVHRTNLGSKVGLDINLNLKRNELFTPLSHDDRQPAGSKLEFWFIIDCSGSMRGPPIRSAKQALKILVKNLPVGCTFNMIKFGSAFHLFRQSVQYYDEMTVGQAERWIEQLNSELGGTDILSPIKKVVNLSTCENRVKQIFLLTDGSVGNTHEIIRVASKAVKPYVNENGETFPNFYDNRIFTLAIGSGASQSLCRELAMKSHGTMEACDETNIAEHSAKLLIASISASKPDNQITFEQTNGLEFALVNEIGHLRNISLSQNPVLSPIFNRKSIPNDLTASVSFISQQLEVNSNEIQDGDKLRVTIKYKHASETTERSFFADCPITVDNISIKGENESLFTKSVGYFAAYKNAINQLEYRISRISGDQKREINKQIAELSVQGHILSSRTAFIGVQKIDSNKSKAQSEGNTEEMEVDDSTDDYVGASEIEIPDFRFNLAERHSSVEACCRLAGFGGSGLAERGFNPIGFDNGRCMVDSMDIGNMRAGAAPRKQLSIKRKSIYTSSMMAPALSQSSKMAQSSMRAPAHFYRSSRNSGYDLDDDDSSENSQSDSSEDSTDGFIQLLNIGNIDGSFTDTPQNLSIFNSILLSKKPMKLSKLLEILGVQEMKIALTILSIFIFETIFPAEKNQWLLFTLKSKQFLQANSIHDVESFLKKLK